MINEMTENAYLMKLIYEKKNVYKNIVYKYSINNRN